MRRFAIAFFPTCLALALAACGDAGDHFLDFHQNPQPQNPAMVKKIVITLPVKPNPKVESTFPLNVVAYDGNGFKIAQGTPLVSSMTVSSNAACYVLFTVQNYLSGAGITMASMPGPIGVGYQPHPATCTKPPAVVTLTVSDIDATPQQVSVSFKSK